MMKCFCDICGKEIRIDSHKVLSDYNFGTCCDGFSINIDLCDDCYDNKYSPVKNHLLSFFTKERIGKVLKKEIIEKMKNHRLCM